MIENFSHPASPGDTEAMLIRLGHLLPDALIVFLQQNDGYERCGLEPVNLWSTRELQLKNEMYEIQKYLPKFFAVGNDGDMVFLLDRSTSDNTNEWPIVVADLGSLDPQWFFGSVGTFAVWQQNNFAHEHLFK